MKATKNILKLLKTNESLLKIDKEIAKYERLVSLNYNPIKYDKMQTKQRELSKLSFDLFQSMTAEEKNYLVYNYGEIYSED